MLLGRGLPSCSDDPLPRGRYRGTFGKDQPVWPGMSTENLIQEYTVEDTGNGTVLKGLSMSVSATPMTHFRPGTNILKK